MDGVGKYSVDDSRETVSTWNVYLPIDVDREVYIKTCFNTGTVTLIGGNGEMVHRVKVGRLAIQVIDFPKSVKELGSKVVCLKDPYNGQLYVVDVFTTSKEVYPQQENQYRLFKVAGGYASVVIDGDGKINISASGEDDKSEINLSVTSKGRKGKLNIKVNGDTTLTNSDGRVLIDSPKIFLNQSDEPILLGTKTVQLISDLLDQLAKESAGPYPLLGSSIYTQIKTGLEELKSKLSFVK